MTDSRQDTIAQAAMLAAIAQGAMVPGLPAGMLLAVPPAQPRAARMVRARRAGCWAARKVRALWDALPGPTWVKVGLLVVCLAIPGPGDEIALIAVAGILAARRARGHR
jgi:hypothetical protein